MRVRQLALDLAASIDLLEQVVGTGQVTDLCSCLGYAPSRNLLASLMINSLCGTFDTFESDGFAAFKERWSSYDGLRGRRVCVDVPEGQLEGIADGIDERGALCLVTSQGRKAIVSGSVRISQEIGSVA